MGRSSGQWDLPDSEVEGTRLGRGHESDADTTRMRIRQYYDLDADTTLIELEAERCSLDSLGAFTDERCNGPAVSWRRTAMIRAHKCGLDRIHSLSSQPYLFKSS